MLGSIAKAAFVCRLSHGRAARRSTSLWNLQYFKSTFCKLLAFFGPVPWRAWRMKLHSAGVSMGVSNKGTNQFMVFSCAAALLLAMKQEAKPKCWSRTRSNTWTLQTFCSGALGLLFSCPPECDGLNTQSINQSLRDLHRLTTSYYMSTIQDYRQPTWSFLWITYPRICKQK